MKTLLAGEGAIARKHAAAITAIDDVELVGLAGADRTVTEQFAQEHGIPRWTVDLDEAMSAFGADAVILATPTPLHTAQAIRAVEAGLHVLVEIPVADSIEDARALDAAADSTDRVVMACHTRRFNPSHQWIHHQIQRGDLQLQHLIVSTFFFRRENRNALGRERSWTDHLLWHHACHTVDLFQYQTGARPTQVWGHQGPPHPDLEIAMDMGIGLSAADGALCTLALSFNNDGPLGTTFRYICDKGTYVAEYDDLVDGWGKAVDVSGFGPSDDGIELQDREFFDAIMEGRRPRSSIRDVMPAMETLGRLARSLPG